MKTETLTQDDIRQDCFICLADDCNGIYMGQYLLQVHGECITGLSEEDRTSILAGPDDEYYDSACCALDNAEINTEIPGTWGLMYDDGGVFAVNYDKIAEWEEATEKVFDW